MIDVLLPTAGVLAASLGFLWVVSIMIGKLSFIDSFWGFGFFVLAVASAYFASDGFSQALGLREDILLLLTTLWGVRLAAYMLWRFLTEGEDQRYARMTAGKEGVARHWYSLRVVFILQGLLMFTVALPVTVEIANGPNGYAWHVGLGMALWAVGAFFEWVGDWQLTRFKNNPDNAGKVLDTGLWAWTRHPNYFGDACLWWGLWFITLDFCTIFAPALMTFMLLKWSGVPLLEKGLKKRRPGYEAYIARTSSFFPRPPKTGN